MRQHAPGVSSASGTAPERSLQPKPPGIGAGEGVTLGVLAGEEPVEAFWAEEGGDVFACAGEGVDGEGGVPGGEVGVDGPGAVGADGVDEEFDAFADDRRHLAPRDEFLTRSVRTTMDEARLMTTKLVSGVASR